MMTRAVPIGLIPGACYSGQIGLVEYLKTMVYDDSLYFLFFYIFFCFSISLAHPDQLRDSPTFYILTEVPKMLTDV